MRPSRTNEINPKFIYWKNEWENKIYRFNNIYVSKKYITYVEPFLGSGVVLFRKPVVDKYEILNDLDDKIFKLVKSKNINNLINRQVTSRLL